MFKKTLLVMALILLTLPLAFATVADVRPHQMVVRADDYSGESSVDVEITVKNPAQYNDNKAVNVSFENGLSIKNYVAIQDNYFILQPDEERVVIFTIDLTGPSYISGSFETTFSGVDEEMFPGHSENFITIWGEGTGGSSQECDGTELSCGTWPDCKNLRDEEEFPDCVDGYKVYYKCEDNVPIIYKTHCISGCCQEYLGPDGYCDGGLNGVCKRAGNNPPTIDSYTPEDLTPVIAEGESLEFNHTSSDLDGDDLTYSWSLNGTDQSTEQNWTFVTEEGDAGVYDVMLEVSDGADTSSQEWEVTVEELSLLANGENCTDDGECNSGHCVHDICRSSSTYCGDDYCDSGESCSSCSSDCGSCNNDDDNDNSGSSGSSGGYGGSSSGDPAKTTGFYDFPTSVSVNVGGKKTIRGKFYSKYRDDQTNLAFKISGINNNWFTISPSSVVTIAYDEDVDININFDIPQDAEAGNYPFKISTKIGSVTYNEKITLTVIGNQATTDTTTTTIENTTNLEGNGEENSSPLTGFIGKASDLAKRFWYIPLILAFLFLLWKLLGVSFVKESADYLPAGRVVGKEVEQVEESEYLEVKEVEPKAETEEEKPEPKVRKEPDGALEKARSKVIEEMRRRAMTMDKR